MTMLLVLYSKQLINLSSALLDGCRWNIFSTVHDDITMSFVAFYIRVMDGVLEAGFIFRNFFQLKKDEDDH